MSAEIDCVVISDHNSGAWIDRLKETNIALHAEKPEGFRPLTIFPGVEISVSGGFHLLAILDLEQELYDSDVLEEKPIQILHQTLSTSIKPLMVNQ